MYSITQQPQNSLNIHNSKRQYRNLKKEKRIFKRIQKKRENERIREWSKFEKLSYARVLLKTMIHEIPVGESFYLYLAQELSRIPRQIYVFHRNMISEFRNKKDIIRELLGSKFQKVSLKSDNVSIRGKQRENKRRQGPVFKWESSIGTDSSQCIFQSEDLTFVQTFLFAQNTPDEMKCADDLIIEITDLEDNQIDFDEESDQLNFQENSLSSLNEGQTLR